MGHKYFSLYIWWKVCKPLVSCECDQLQTVLNDQQLSVFIDWTVLKKLKQPKIEMSAVRINYEKAGLTD